MPETTLDEGFWEEEAARLQNEVNRLTALVEGYERELDSRKDDIEYQVFLLRGSLDDCEKTLHKIEDLL